MVVRQTHSQPRASLMPRRWVIAVAVLVLAVAAGCGGHQRLSENAYIREVNRQTADIRYAVEQADAVRGSAPLKERRRKLRAAARDVRLSARELDGLDPPKRWEDEHSELVRSVDGLGAALARLADASPTDAAQRRARYRQVQAAAERGGRAIATINAQRRGGGGASGLSDNVFEPPVSAR